MKKRTFIIGNILSTAIFVTMILFSASSCREDKEKTVVIEKQVEAPKAKEGDGTSISVGKDGVEFSTKKGDKKTEVIIKD